MGQLECAYQSNLESNFPVEIVAAVEKRKKHKLAVLDLDFDEEKGDEDEEYNMALHLFNNCLLSDLSKLRMQRENLSAAPTYCLRFGFNQNNQITYMYQLRIYDLSGVLLEMCIG